MKYMILEDFSGAPLPIIFPGRIDHAELREQLPYSRVLSGGYVELEGGSFRCYGEAPSLKTTSRTEDGNILLEHFAEDK